MKKNYIMRNKSPKQYRYYWWWTWLEGYGHLQCRLEDLSFYSKNQDKPDMLAHISNFRDPTMRLEAKVEILAPESLGAREADREQQRNPASNKVEGEAILTNTNTHNVFTHIEHSHYKKMTI